MTNPKETDDIFNAYNKNVQGKDSLPIHNLVSEAGLGWMSRAASKVGAAFGRGGSQGNVKAQDTGMKYYDKWFKPAINVMGGQMPGHQFKQALADGTAGPKIIGGETGTPLIDTIKDDEIIDDARGKDLLFQLAMDAHAYQAGARGADLPSQTSSSGATEPGDVGETPPAEDVAGTDSAEPAGDTAADRIPPAPGAEVIPPEAIGLDPDGTTVWPNDGSGTNYYRGIDNVLYKAEPGGEWEAVPNTESASAPAEAAGYGSAGMMNM